MILTPLVVFPAIVHLPDRPFQPRLMFAGKGQDSVDQWNSGYGPYSQALD
jgi:hypothetical protein